MQLTKGNIWIIVFLGFLLSVGILIKIIHYVGDREKYVGEKLEKELLYVFFSSKLNEYIDQSELLKASIQPRLVSRDATQNYFSLNDEIEHLQKYCRYHLQYKEVDGYAFDRKVKQGVNLDELGRCIDSRLSYHSPSTDNLKFMVNDERIKKYGDNAELRIILNQVKEDKIISVKEMVEVYKTLQRVIQLDSEHNLKDQIDSM